MTADRGQDFVEEDRMKCFIRVVDLCKIGVSQLNGSGYSPKHGKNTTFIRLKCLLNQPKIPKKKLNSG